MPPTEGEWIMVDAECIYVVPGTVVPDTAAPNFGTVTVERGALAR